MRTGRIAVFHGPNQPLVIETVPVPPLREGEILVRNEYVALCRSDLNTFSGKRTEKTPTILGHEVVGVIEELGPGAPRKDCRDTELCVGNRVTWAIFASDPNSLMSRAGIPQKAPGLFKYGHEPITPESTFHGGLGEYCVLRQHTPVIRLDAPLPLKVMALINCSVATVAGSLRLAGNLAGKNVVIAGAGMLGTVACAMARRADARRIIAVDIVEERLAVATKFGADSGMSFQTGSHLLKEELASLTGGEPVSVAMDFSGVPETMEALIGALGVGGAAVLVGATFPQRALQVNAEQLVRNVHTLKGLHNYNEQDLIAAADFIERNFRRFPFEDLVLDQFDLDSVNEGFARGLGFGVYRVGIRIGP
ncbi:MAG TPA: zinc-binding dehydrogenase [Candidatus Acidoferrales bacterium]|nr:zinc-binding dehydrogenase [Candidatus Acidoferrales bacterium]